MISWKRAILLLSLRYFPHPSSLSSPSYLPFSHIYSTLVSFPTPLLNVWDCCHVPSYMDGHLGGMFSSTFYFPFLSSMSLCLPSSDQDTPMSHLVATLHNYSSLSPISSSFLFCFFFFFLLYVAHDLIVKMRPFLFPSFSFCFGVESLPRRI